MRRCWKLSPSSSPRLFLQGSRSTTRALAGACVGTGALTAHRQTALVAEAPIRSQIDQTLDRQLYFTTQITFDREHTNVFADTLEFSVRQIFYFLCVFNTGGFANFASTRATDTKNCG